jgi:hypothetical protein
MPAVQPKKTKLALSSLRSSDMGNVRNRGQRLVDRGGQFILAATTVEHESLGFTQQ